MGVIDDLRVCKTTKRKTNGRAINLPRNGGTVCFVSN